MTEINTVTGLYSMPAGTRLYRIVTRMDFLQVAETLAWCRSHCFESARLTMPEGRDFIYIWHFTSQEDATLFTLAHSDCLVYE
jgi:hypothetical protein